MDLRRPRERGRQADQRLARDLGVMYSAGGHAIEHLYYQKEADLPPPLVALRRDSHSVALVQYDPSIQVWRFFSVNNSAGSGTGPSTRVMTGRLDEEVLVF